jgi:hypothetical protein
MVGRFIVGWHAQMDGRSNYLEPCHHPTALVGWPARCCTKTAAWVAQSPRLAGALPESMARRVLCWHRRRQRHGIVADFARERGSVRGAAAPSVFVDRVTIARTDAAGACRSSLVAAEESNRSPACSLTRSSVRAGRSDADPRQEHQARALPPPQHDDAALAEHARKTNEGPWIARHEQVRFMPTPQCTLRRHHDVTAETFAQTPLHAIVPAIRHPPGQRIPGGDERRAASMQMPEQRVRNAMADADIDALRTVDRVTVGAQQTRRDRPDWRGMHKARRARH